MGSILYPDLNNSQACVLISLFIQLKHLDKAINNLNNSRGANEDLNEYLNRLIDILRKKWLTIFYEIMRITNQEKLIKELANNQTLYSEMQQKLLEKLQQFLANPEIRAQALINLGRSIDSKKKLIATYDNFISSSKTLLAPNGIMAQTINSSQKLIDQNNSYLNELAQLEREHPEFAAEIAEDRKQTEQMNESLTAIKDDTQDLMQLMQQNMLEIQQRQAQQQSLLQGLTADRQLLEEGRLSPERLAALSPETIALLTTEEKTRQEASATTPPVGSDSILQAAYTAPSTSAPVTDYDLAEAEKIRELAALNAEIRQAMLECNEAIDTQQEKLERLQDAIKLARENKNVETIHKLLQQKVTTSHSLVELQQKINTLKQRYKTKSVALLAATPPTTTQQPLEHTNKRKPNIITPNFDHSKTLQPPLIDDAELQDAPEQDPTSKPNPSKPT